MHLQHARCKQDFGGILNLCFRKLLSLINLPLWMGCSWMICRSYMRLIWQVLLQLLLHSGKVMESRIQNAGFHEW
jgi:hypothetical protein